MESIIFENKKFRLEVGSDAITQSLVFKKTGEDLLMSGEEISLFSLTQKRPFNNEVKLAYMNKRTTFEANSLSLSENELTVGFEVIPCKAVVTVDIRDEYISFTLKDLIYPPYAYGKLCMDLPPVEELRLLQLPLKNRENFGPWINALWDDSTSCAVVAVNPEARIDSERRHGYRILTADATKEVGLRGTSAAIIVGGDKEDFLNSLDKFERDYGLPLGVESRRSEIINRSIYWTDKLTPENVDEHINYAKAGGFSCMLLYYECMCPMPDYWTYGTLGDYSISGKYPRGYEDLRAVLGKIKDAGITPGIHILHTHVGYMTKHVTPVADARLNITDYFTLTRPLGLDDGEIFVAQNPRNAVMHEKRRVLKFGGELMSYEGYSTEPPYRFFGVKRGHWGTNITAHEAGIIGGVLDISEYSAQSVYIDQHTDMQDELAEEIAKIYDCGFEFIYFDGSEGVNPPYEYHVPNAQHRVLKKLGSSPRFCEGAAKAHFNWHALSGANAFDIFKTDVFKRMIDKHPLSEAPHMSRDFTRLNFGWWAFFDDTRRDVYEYGTSHAHGWSCPVTMKAHLPRFKTHARTADILEVMRRWEAVRRDNLLTPEQQKMIREPEKEFTLFKKEDGKLELLPYFELKDFCPDEKNLYAFTLERNGRSYALLWHNTGAVKIRIPLENADISYVSDLTGESLPIEKTDGEIVIEVAASAYLSAPIPTETLREALKKACVI